MDPVGLAPLLSCCLIVLRPIGIGEVARPIIAKAVLYTIGGDIKRPPAQFSFALVRLLDVKQLCMQ